MPRRFKAGNMKLYLRVLVCAGLTAALLAAKPIVILHPDDTMYHPQPKAAAANWQPARGRQRLTLPVLGAVLRGYRYLGKMPTGVVLLVFGGAGNLIQRHDGAMRGFARFASAVEWYDYRGYGYSSGQAHFEALQSDALRMFDAAARHAGPGGRIVVLGYSMGTAIADFVALNRPVEGLILAAPWSNYATARAFTDGKHAYRLTLAAAKVVDEMAMVRNIAAPLLVINGSKDDVIPPAQGREVEAAAASARKSFVQIPGAKHEWLMENPNVQSAVHAFLTSSGARKTR